MNNYHEYICNPESSIFQGSWHTTKSEILNFYGIDSILYIGFDPNFLDRTRLYKRLDFNDNPQSAKMLSVELPNILLWISEQLSSPSSLDPTRNKRVLICCSAGRSRSVTLVMAYLMMTRKMTSQEALDFIQVRRPVANPNPCFVKVLDEYFDLLKT